MIKKNKKNNKENNKNKNKKKKNKRLERQKTHHKIGNMYLAWMDKILFTAIQQNDCNRRLIAIDD
jgi:hypothetical protein